LRNLYHRGEKTDKRVYIYIEREWKREKERGKIAPKEIYKGTSRRGRYMEKRKKEEDEAALRRSQRAWGIKRCAVDL